MKTMIVVILICMLLLFLLKVPVYISMALTGCALMMATSGMKWSILTQYLYTGTNSFTLLAIPLFLLAAKLMNTGGITKKLFAFCMKVVGWLPGGLGHVNILSSVIFAGMSGTAVSDAGGLGAIETKAMNENGFDNDFSCFRCRYLHLLHTDITGCIKLYFLHHKYLLLFFISMYSISYFPYIPAA